MNRATHVTLPARVSVLVVGGGRRQWGHPFVPDGDRPFEATADRPSLCRVIGLVRHGESDWLLQGWFVPVTAFSPLRGRAGRHAPRQVMVRAGTRRVQRKKF